MSNEDRELLEDAAKAAGIEKHYPFGPGEIYVRFSGLWAHRDTSDAIGALKIWNPLADDGDALRLAVRLNLHVSIDAESAGAITIEWDFDAGGSARQQIVEAAPVEGDDYAATRRAIVRAAAAIGEAQ